jgi:asparagine synthase (glutamine-hydrolysing)
VPNALRVSATQRKILLSRLAARLLPADFDVSRKQGFSVPLAVWLTPRLQATWCDRYAALLGDVFDFSAVRSILGPRHAGGTARIFSLFFLMHWMEAYGVTM